jgi:predicted transcriptional regulator
MQLVLEKKTGRVYDERSVTEKKLSFNGRTFVVKHYPIKSITEFTVGDVEESDYEVDLDNGIIYMDFPCYDLSVEIEYVTDTPTDINLAKAALAGMVLDKISNRGSTVDNYIQQLKRLTLRGI